MAQRTNTAAASNPTLPRDAKREAASALNFWQAVEYFDYQDPPDRKTENCVWAIGAEDKSFPWHDSVKRTIVEHKIGAKYRFQVFAGIVSGQDLVDTARRYLGADQIDMTERQAPKPVASLVINVDSRGVATGEIFLSTVPWALGRLASSVTTNGPLNFEGFFGAEGANETILTRIRELLVERRLLREFTNEATAHSSAREYAADEPGSGVSPEPPVASPVAAAESDAVRELTLSDIEAVTSLAFNLCGWRPERCKPVLVRALKAPEDELERPRAQDDPLNSFYAQDLERVSREWEKGNIGKGLACYLSGEDAHPRVDLDRDRDALIDGVHPSTRPAGCWPAEHPLVTAQQYAVNTMLAELVKSGLFSVNGPPGTGKTTLLKDIVADVLVKRADALMRFKATRSAFTSYTVEGYSYPLHRLDPTLCGFGIVVASSNNNAVENISKELPSRSAIAAGMLLDYFAAVADSVAAPKNAQRREESCWGMIAAALGKMENRRQFVKRFWFEPKAQRDSKVAPAADPLRFRSLRSIVEANEHGALSWEDARAGYNDARATVQALHEQSCRLIESLRDAEAAAKVHRDLQNELDALDRDRPPLEAAASAAEAAVGDARAALSSVLARYAALSGLNESARRLQRVEAEHASMQAMIGRDGLQVADTVLAYSRKQLDRVTADIEIHALRRPGFWAELFGLESSKRWSARDVELDGLLAAARASEQEACARVEELERLTGQLEVIGRERQTLQHLLQQMQHDAETAGVSALDSEVSLAAARLKCEDQLAERLRLKEQALKQQEAATARRRQLCAALARVRMQIDALNEAVARHPLRERELRSWMLHGLDRDAMHISAPYMTQEIFDARRNLFVAVMELHKAFIVDSWKWLRPALSAFVDHLRGVLPPGFKAKDVIQLWDAFFMVVPVVSSTFASVPRQFSAFGREDLGWLLIDEAGQATPQQAVGAIWRAKRIVVVGDPLQLEPIVTLPKEIVGPLLRRCSAEQQWMPPTASAQSLSDRANRYGMLLGTEDDDGGKRWVGSPLLVHRRCLDPMFRIANRIAYGGKMVYGTDADDAGSGLTPSSWIHIPADSADGHWIQAQGDHALTLVEQLTDGRLRAATRQPRVYVITPFSSVSEKLKAAMFRRFGAQSHDLVGTVHTFQGKEAESVIFVLGGDPKKSGVVSSFAGAKPNLVNVAVTRAKHRLYVIGDLGYWTGSSDVRGLYNEMADNLALVQPDVLDQ